MISTKYSSYMLRTSSIRLAVALAITLPALGSSGGQGVPAPVGLKSQEWVIGGVKRTGFVAFPTKKSAAGAPLVLVFHGHGGTAANMSRALNIHDKWAEAVVIYLQGLPTAGTVVDRAGRMAGWQSEPGELGDRDVRLVDSVIAWAKKDFTIDPKRVFATGHSNGGWFTYVLWAVRPDQFAAFAPASAVFGRMVTSAKPKPALIMAGRRDRLVPFGLQQRTIDAVLDLNKAAAKGEAWFGGAELHESKVADVVTYVYAGGHPPPENAAAVVTRFFKSQ